MKKTMIILGLFLCVVAYAQEQTMNLSMSHNHFNVEWYFDFIHVDREFIFKTEYDKSDLIRIRNDDNSISIRSRIWIQYNDTLLKSRKQKKGILSNLDHSDIIFVKKIKKEDAILIYGRKAKHGVIILKSDSSKLIFSK